MSTTADVRPDLDILPSNVEAERVILGGILLDNECFFDETAELEAEDFSLDSHRKIYLVMSEIMFGMVEGATQADIITLSNELAKRHWIEFIGGVAYLASLTEGLPRRPKIDNYIRILKEKAKLRKLMRVCNNVYSRAQDQQEKAEELSEHLQGELIEIGAEGADQAVSLSGIEVEQEIKAKRQTDEKRTALELTWGLAELDEFTHGAFKGEWTILAGEASGGKMMDVEELIPTPYGMVRNGDLDDGDEVFGEDGRVYKVLQAHPIKEEEGFRVSFDDGTSTVVHGGHLWHTWTFSDRQKKFKQSMEFREHRRKTRKDHPSKGIRQYVDRNKVFYSYQPPALKGKVRTTDEIRKTLIGGNRRHANHSIQVAKPLQIPYRQLPIDPYVLGAWLGDGTSAKAEITIGRQDQKRMLLSMSERGCWLNPRSYDDLMFSISNEPREFVKELKTLGVFKNKHIPDAYFWSSHYQRLELLRGLMDTDGCCNEDGQVEFTNTKYDLAVGVYRLAASLGVKPYWDEGIAKLNGKVCGPKYRVKWTAPLECFTLPRKLKRLPDKQPEKTRWRYIVSVEPVGKRLMRCITTSNPSGLYLFGINCNVTHNTAKAVEMAIANGLEGIPVGIFSMEMTKEQLKKRFYPAMSKILTGNHIRDPRLLNQHTHIPELERMTQEIARLPIYIDDSSPLRIDKLIARMRIMRRKHGCKLFIVDYLQLIGKMPKLNSIDGFAQVVFALRDFPKAEPDCHLLVLSQYSKEQGFTKSKTRSKDSLYGGSVINHAAQNILMIKIEDAEKTDADLLEVEIRIAKQRDGKRGRVKCYFDKDHLRFTQLQSPLN